MAAAAASRPNFDDRSGNKQQLIDLLLFDTDEDREEDFVRGAWAKKSVFGGFSDLSLTVCGSAVCHQQVNSFRQKIV